MNDLETNDPLETVVRDALRADADQAPKLPEEWHHTPVMSMAPTSQTPTRWRSLVVGVAAAGLLVAALGVVAARPFDSAPAASPQAWVPPGTEFVSTDQGPATTVYDGPVVAALSRQIGIDGHPPQVVTTSLAYVGYATAVEQVCSSEEGSRGCRELWSTRSWSTSVTSSVDNGFASFDLWTIEGLPANAAFVSYSDGDLQLWQRPIMGFAAFPNVQGRDEIVIAYDGDGIEVGRFGAAQQAASFPDNESPLLADISKTEFAVLSDLTTNNLRECLTTGGGTLVGDVATFPSNVDQIAVWDQCVEKVNEIVADAVKDLNPRFYDPSTDRPQNPDPALVFND
jgi:hypothetical protein